MSKKSILILMVLMLSMAACGTNETPTVDNSGNDQNTTDNSGTVESNIVVVTRAATVETLEPGALPILPAGTLVASETEDPNADTPFTYIMFERWGGPGDVPEVTIRINRDGSATFNDVATFIPLGVIDEIQRSLLEINFFGLQGNMMGTPGTGEEFYYRLTVNREGQERAITSQDGYMPNEYKALLAQFVKLTFN
ncbi:hypothetical protein MASR2M15_02440 [Anaerolineales bacterium]